MQSLLNPGLMQYTSPLYWNTHFIARIDFKRLMLSCRNISHLAMQQLYPLRTPTRIPLHVPLAFARCLQEHMLPYLSQSHL